jgi:hypothetical protein
MNSATSMALIQRNLLFIVISPSFASAPLLK